MKRLARDMSKLLDWPRFGIYFNFRDIPDTVETSPCDLLFAGRVPKDTVCRAYKWLLEHQEDVIFYFDGLDQATWSISDKTDTMQPHDIRSTRVIMSNIMNGNLFPNVKIIYSSREHAVSSLEGPLRPSIVIALAGLAYIDVEWLFIQLVGEGGAELWRKLITESPSLVALCSIPAFLHFTAIVYKSNPVNPPKYVTGIMKELISIFMQSGHISERNITKVLKGLKQMAFNGMGKRKVVFTVDDVKQAGLEVAEVRDWVIKVPGLNRLNYFLLEGQFLFFFSHQILQEVLAAYHISEMDMDTFTEFGKNKLTDNHWSVVERFVSGILLNKEGEDTISKVSDYEEKKKLLQDILSSQYNVDYVAQKMELYAAIYESNDGKFIRSLVHDINFSDIVIGASGIYILSSIMRHYSHLSALQLTECSLVDETLQILWDNIKDSSISVQELDFSGNNLDAAGDRLIWQIAQHCEVNTFTFMKEGYVEELKLEVLQDIKLPKLKYLKLSGIYLSGESLPIFASCLPDDVQLTLLHCDLEPRLQEFKLAMGSKKLRKLDVSGYTYLCSDEFRLFWQIAQQCEVGAFIIKGDDDQDQDPKY